MKIPLSLLSAIETALHAWLQLDGESLDKCKGLAGKIIRLHITGLDLNIFFLPAVSGIQLMANYPDSALADAQDDAPESLQSQTAKVDSTVDATIHGSPMALMRLATAGNAGVSMLEGDVEIDGDMRVAEAFSNILREIDIDWEELLSKLVGDIIAHQTGQVVRSGTHWFKQTAEAMTLNTGEYLSEESKVTPADAEINHYMDQVDTVRMHTDRLVARVQNLQNTLYGKSQKILKDHPKEEEI